MKTLSHSHNEPYLRTCFQAALALLFIATGLRTAPAQTIPRIVFQAPVTVTKRVSYNQIFSMNPDGSGVLQLTTLTTNTVGPRWSPGQTYISFWRGNTLWVMQAEGEAKGGQSFTVALLHAAGQRHHDLAPCAGQ